MTGSQWRNWAENQIAHPIRTVTPRSVAELRTVVVDAAASGIAVKCIGAGHSFTSIAVTDGIHVDLDRIAGIRAVTPIDGGALVTVFAGTRLRDLTPLLWDLGLAMTNLGDIDEQSVAGAISTGTHGTGARFGGISTQVRALELLTADGRTVRCSGDDALFAAARVGLGGLGIITEVTLECVSAFAMRAVEAPATLTDTLAELDDVVDSVDHFEFYWFPHTDRVLTKRNTRLPGDIDLRPLGRLRSYLDDELLSNSVFEGLNRVVTRKPLWIPRLNAISARALSARDYTDRSYRVFASSRTVKFREMEYAVPAAEIGWVIREVDRWLESSSFSVAFPVEVRFAAPDDIWLSTAYGRQSAYIAVHQYHRRDHREYFDAVEAICRSVGGRPHWGKLHTMTAPDLRSEYAHFDDFLALRDELDPERVFGNEYLTTVLGS